MTLSCRYRAVNTMGMRPPTVSAPNAVDVICREPKHVNLVRPIRHKAASRNEEMKWIYGWQAMAGR